MLMNDVISYDTLPTRMAETYVDNDKDDKKVVKGMVHKCGSAGCQKS
jgi:hypothetical protein